MTTIENDLRFQDGGLTNLQDIESISFAAAGLSMNAVLDSKAVDDSPAAYDLPEQRREIDAEVVSPLTAEDLDVTAELDLIGRQRLDSIPSQFTQGRILGVGDEDGVQPNSLSVDIEAQLATVEAFDGILPELSVPETSVTAKEEFTVVEAPGRHDQYVHIKFTEYGSPSLAREAWRIHAEGYHSMGFVKDDAITPEGFLAEGIDKSQGPDTDYYLALNPNNELDAATMRLDNVPEGQTYESLPGYQISKDKLTDFGIALLEDMQKQGMNIKEIAAMARTEQASPMAVHEIIRQFVHEGRGKDVVWFFSIVTTTFDSLIKTLGEKNLVVIGEDVPIPDDRVNPAIKLRPTLVRADCFYERLVSSYLEAETPQDRHHLARSILFFTDGLSEDEMSEAVLQARNAILVQRRGQ